MCTQEEIAERGRLVALEGIDRAGKSSVFRLLPALLSGCKVSIVSCAERQSPLEHLLHGEVLGKTSPFIKTFLFAADRSWPYEQICVPALESGALVVWDRYVDSAIAYRTVDFALGESLIDIEFVKKINSPFQRPALTLLIDIPVEISLARAMQEGKREPYDEDFLRRVREVYLELARTDDYVVISGEAPVDAVAADAARAIRTRFKELF